MLGKAMQQACLADQSIANCNNLVHFPLGHIGATYVLKDSVAGTRLYAMTQSTLIELIYILSKYDFDKVRTALYIHVLKSL